MHRRLRGYAIDQQLQFNNHSICGTHSIANIEVLLHNVHLMQAEQDIGKFTASLYKNRVLLSVWHMGSRTYETFKCSNVSYKTTALKFSQSITR
jgi:hypothetical protein